MACNRCGMDGDCVLKDDFSIVRPHLLEADMVVFVTPMYYFGFSAQIKSVIDRFYAINGRIKGAPKKTAFLMAYANSAYKDAEAIRVHYATLADYLGWSDMESDSSGRMDNRVHTGYKVRRKPINLAKVYNH